MPEGIASVPASTPARRPAATYQGPAKARPARRSAGRQVYMRVMLAMRPPRVLKDIARPQLRIRRLRRGGVSRGRGPGTGVAHGTEFAGWCALHGYGAATRVPAPAAATQVQIYVAICRVLI